MDTKTDYELIAELAKRHTDLIVIRPKASNIVGDAELRVFCKTSDRNGTYDLFEVLTLLHDAEIGLMRDCLVKDDD